MVYEIIYAKKFKKQSRRLEKSGIFNRARLDEAIDILASGKDLDSSYHDHALQGDWQGYRECHIENDLLLIYEIDNNILMLTLYSIGSHSSLFG